MLIIPGGAYLFVSVANEGAEVAARLTAQGYTVFVLTYRLPGEGWSARPETPLQDAQRAIRVIRVFARGRGLSPEKVFALGFSAGGHLTASLATATAPAYEAVDGTDQQSFTPAAAALIYPVITLTRPFGHAASRAFLLGNDQSAERVARWSPERRVSNPTPSIFLAHALNDTTVAADNSLMMMSACREAKRPVEGHFFQEGEHAFGVGYAGSPSQKWLALFDAWLRRLTG